MRLINKEWLILEEQRKVQADNLIEKILKQRGIKDIDRFLKPTKKDLLPFKLLKNIDKAGQVVINGLKENKRFMVFYDQDLDGDTSGTIMYRYLRHFSDNIQWSIGIGKKHGLNNYDIKQWVGNIDIVIVVDSSSGTFKEHKFLKDNGIDVVVLDHHQVSEESRYAIVVNSQFDYPNPHLSGAGVAFKFVQYLDKLLGTKYSNQYWDLAATGLIADMMDIGEQSPENRYICYRGFNTLINPGLKEVIGNYTFNGQSVSYSIAPLINSAMRMNENELAVKLLLEDNPKECRKIIKQIKELKAKQDAFKNSIVQQLDFQIRVKELDKNKVISVIIDDNVEHIEDSKGLTGLIANELASKYQRPVIVLHHDEMNEEEFKGSMRGVGIDNFRDYILKTEKVIYCEGHNNAAGLALKVSDYAELTNRLNHLLKDVEFKLVNKADIVLDIDDVTFGFVEQLSDLSLITGTGFEPVKVVLKNVEIFSTSTMSGIKHLKWETEHLEFIKWNVSDIELKDFKVSDGIFKTCDILGNIQINKFAGQKRLQVIINDYKNVKDNLLFLR